MLSPHDSVVPAYPVDGTPRERLLHALRFAVLAPSGHNAQPWLFRVHEASLELIADRSRALPVVDPDDRELVIGCGAALHHLTTCLSAMGETTNVQLLADAHEPDVLARVELGARAEPQARDRRWLEASLRRRTTRFAFEPLSIPDGILDLLRAVCREESASLHVVSGPGRAALGALILEADREQLSQKAFRRELAAWVHPNRSRHRDGIPGYTQGIGDWMSALGPFVVRTFDISESQAAKDEDLVEHSPVLAVLTTDADDVRSHVHAGRALSALLLEATSHGLAASFLNQAIEVPQIRAQLAELLASGNVFPQLVLRLGNYSGPALKSAPRREVETVIVS